MILQNSGGKKILYLGQATESVKAGYNNLHRYWKFNVPKFILYTGK